MDIMIAIGIITIGVFAYSMGAWILFQEKPYHIKLSLLTVIGCSVLYGFIIPNKTNLLYLQISAILILWILFQGSVQHKTLITIKTVFIITCIEEMFEALISLVMEQFLHWNLSSVRRFILANAIMVLGFLLMVLKKKNFKFIQKKYADTLTFIAMGLLAVALIMLVASLQYAKQFTDNQRFLVFTDGLTIVSYFGIGILAAFVFYVRNASENYKKLLETESFLRKLQKEHYEVLLTKEEETRHFRHDITNYIVCLKEMVVNDRLKEADQYIDEMYSAIETIHGINYTTGNEIIDTMLSYYLPQLHQDVQVSVTGKWNGNLKLNQIEMCTIISNLLQNALEALNGQTVGEKFLKINMKSTQQNMKIEIRNTFGGNQLSIREGLPGTSKHNKELHGIGLKNVKKVVEKYSGVFEYEVLEHEFVVSVILHVD